MRGGMAGNAAGESQLAANGSAPTSCCMLRLDTVTPGVTVAAGNL